MRRLLTISFLDHLSTLLWAATQTTTLKVPGADLFHPPHHGLESA